MSDYFDELMGNETSPMGSSVDGEYDMSIDPSFLNKKKDDWLEEITKQRTRADQMRDVQKQRTDKMATEVAKGPRERADEYFNQGFKAHYGFTPDKGIKKVAGTLIDTIMSMVPILNTAGFGGIRQRADFKGSRDYENVTRAYNQLASQEAASGRIEQNANQLALTQMAQQKSLEEKTKEAEVKANLEKQKQDMTKALGMRGLDIKENQGNRSLDIREADSETKAQMAKTAELLNITKAQDLQRVYDNKLKWDQAHPDFPFEMMVSMNDQKMGIMSAMHIVPAKVVSDWLDIKSDLANMKEKDNGVITGKFPRTQVDANGQPQTVGMDVFSVPKPGALPYRRKFGTSENIENGTPSSTPNTTVSEPVRKIISAITSPKTNIASKEQEPTNPVDAAKFYFDKSEQTKGNLNSGLSSNAQGAASRMVKDFKEREKWQQTTRILNNLADNAVTGLANGDTQAYRGALNQLGPVKKFREAFTGRGSAEIQQVGSSVFAMAEHLKNRFQSGRPAFQLIQMLESSIDNPLDTPEAYSKAQLAVSLLGQMAMRDKQDPQYFGKAMDKLDEAYKGQKGGTWAESVNQILDQTINDAKSGKGYQKIDINRVFNQVLGNLKNSPKANEPQVESVIDRIKRKRKEALANGQD